MKPSNQKFWDRIKDMSYEAAERKYFAGHLSQDDWERFCKIWEWSAPRYFAHAQNRWHDRFGPLAVGRRINRLRRALGLDLLDLAYLEKT